MATTTAQRHIERGRLAVLTGGHAVDDLYQGAVPALLTFLVAERHYTYAAATGITFAATFLSSVAQPGFGLLSDRHRLAWLAPVGMATAGVGVGLSGVADGYGATFAAIALSGLGVAAYHPAASRAARTAAGGSATGMSWFAVGGTLGFALGPVLVTTVVGAAGLAATPVLAAPALLGAAVVGALARRPRTRAVAPPAPAAHRPVEDRRAFLVLTGVVICRSVAFFGVSSLLALHLTERFGVGRATGNAALTVLFAAGAVATLVGGRQADRRGRVPVVRTSHLLTLPGLVVLVAAPTVAVAQLAVVLLGFGLYLAFSVQVTLGQEYLPTRVGTASGVTLGLAVSVGGVLAPAWGALADATSLRTALAALVLFPVAGLLLTTRLPEPGRGGAVSGRA